MYWRENILLPIRLIERRKMALKKVYEAPMLEIEEYCLDTSIASNCATVVHNGPAMGSHSQCDDYVNVNPFPDDDEISLASEPRNVSFYEDTACDCYTTGGNGSYWTS